MIGSKQNANASVQVKSANRQSPFVKIQLYVGNLDPFRIGFPVSRPRQVSP